MGDLSDLQIAETLRAHGLRVTPQRRAIWAVFARGKPGHLSAEDVLRRARHLLPELARGTVYNSLAEFAAAGLLGTIEQGGSQLYDPNVEPHEHFRCTVCGTLFDVHAAGADRLAPAEPGFTVNRTQVLFEGTCPRCSS